jgi:hypothetical protein
MSDAIIQRMVDEPHRDPTEAKRAIRATVSGAILGILLALLGRRHPEK